MDLCGEYKNFLTIGNTPGSGWILRGQSLIHNTGVVSLKFLNSDKGVVYFNKHGLDMPRTYTVKGTYAINLMTNAEKMLNSITVSTARDCIVPRMLFVPISGMNNTDFKTYKVSWGGSSEDPPWVVDPQKYSGVVDLYPNSISVIKSWNKLTTFAEAAKVSMSAAQRLIMQKLGALTNSQMGSMLKRWEQNQEEMLVNIAPFGDYIRVAYPLFLCYAHAKQVRAVNSALPIIRNAEWPMATTGDCAGVLSRVLVDNENY